MHGSAIKGFLKFIYSSFSSSSYCYYYCLLFYLFNFIYLFIIIIINIFQFPLGGGAVALQPIMCIHDPVPYNTCFHAVSIHMMQKWEKEYGSLNYVQSILVLEAK